MHNNISTIGNMVSGDGPRIFQFVKPNISGFNKRTVRKASFKVALPLLFVCLLFSPACSHMAERSETVRQQIERKIAEAHTGWKQSDVNAMVRLEHPEIHKLISYDKVIVGAEHSRRDLEAAVNSYNFEVSQFDIEDFQHLGEVVTFYSIITLEGRPKNQGYPFSVTSRTFSVWTRDPQNPDQWVSFREVVQQMDQDFHGSQ